MIWPSHVARIHQSYIMEYWKVVVILHVYRWDGTRDNDGISLYKINETQEPDSGQLTTLECIPYKITSKEVKE